MRIDQIELSGSLFVTSSASIILGQTKISSNNNGSISFTNVSNPTQKVIGSYSGSFTGSIKLPTVPQGAAETNILLVNGSGNVVYRSNLSLTGAQGNQGATGVQGTNGTVGTQGFQGNQGPQGNQGIQGTVGTQGSQGANIASTESRPSPINADQMCIWFDTTSKMPMVSYCINTSLVGAWSAGGALITTRRNLAGAGTQNVGLVAGGNNGARTACTEEYNKPLQIFDCFL
jgi:hypothetical protein